MATLIWFWVMLLGVMILLLMQTKGLWLEEFHDQVVDVMLLLLMEAFHDQVVLWSINLSSISDHTDSHGAPSFVLDGGRFIHGSGVAAIKPPSVDGAVLDLRDGLHKASNIADAIQVSGLHSKAG
ncbi:hypothetical protein TorRG33x02_075330 [Trema orientale]|uniref:Uncharacterized protein n=1 Tax=Trema orientale TaxID=63057 RepID=A0A2P5FFI8_TREOI|nr:hypothetical protein TorRG33x02_075330 [Trema orientale]